MDSDDIPKQTGEAAYGFVGAFFKQKKKDAEKFFLKNKVGFVPPSFDYKSYTKLKNSAIFKLLKHLIGNKHPSLRIVLTGLFVSALDKETKCKYVDEIRTKIHKEEGPRGITILNWVTTGFVEGFIKWLTKFNLEKNPTQEELIEVYENLLDDWQERTIFVQRFDKTKIIINKAISKMGVGKNIFFMFASRSALDVAKGAIKTIHDDGLSKQYRYNISKEKVNEDELENVWIFEKIPDELYSNVNNIKLTSNNT